MKRLKKTMAGLLAALMLISIMPAAFAGNNESVLTSLNLTGTNTASNIGASRDITLYVPYTYPTNTVDLINGLNITWDTGTYKAVVATPESATITVDNTAYVKVNVTYNRLTEPDGTPQSTTVYNIRVYRTTAAPPTFSGIITKTQQYASVNLTFNITAGNITDLYNAHDGDAIGSITISGSNPDFGTIGYDLTTQPHLNVNPSSPTDVIFSFVASNTGTVSYTVTAYTDNPTPVPVGTAVVTLTAYKTPEKLSDITDAAYKGAVKTFSASYFTSHCNLYGVPINYVDITPTNTTYSTWKFGTTTITGIQRVTAAQLGLLSFTANSNGIATFNWVVTTTNGDTVSGTGTIDITSPTLTLYPYTAPSSVMRGGTWNAFSISHFVHTPASASISFIKITTVPTASDGVLMLTATLPANSAIGYPEIKANTALKAGAVIPASYLNRLVLTTKTTAKESYTAFTWTATADSTVTGATWGDPATYTVHFASGGVIQAATDMNIPTPLPADSILSTFRAAAGQPLSYITFTLPDKNAGILYSSYDLTTKKGTAITASTKYYASKTTNLSGLSFVPAKDFTGTLDVTYNAYAENGSFLTGIIRFSVTNNPGGTISYITDKNSPLQLDANDIQTAFYNATGKELSSINFSVLPSAASGTLYYNYTLSGEYDSTVAQSSYYQYTYNVLTSPYLSLISFVPYRNFTGRVAISYRGYTSQNATPYYGKIYIDVVDSPAGIVNYSVKENGRVSLTASDFSNEFIGVTGSILSYVTFAPPSGSGGSLYSQYDAAAGTGTKIASATKYYDGKGPDISDIIFVPDKDFVGVYTVPYTACSINGVTYAGKLKFFVYEGSGVITYTAEAGTPLSLKASDFITAFNANSEGKALSYVTFDTPTAAYGTLYYNYTSATKFDSVVTGSKKYYAAASPYISNVSFVPQDGFTGALTLYYTGYTSSGESFRGKIKINVSTSHNGSVSYETNALTPVSFTAADFIAAFAGKSPSPLSYVRFAQPASSYGRLYYGYNAGTGQGSIVNSSSAYYVSGYPSLSSLTFVPNQEYAGTLAISYTAYDTSGNAFSGAVIITVRSSDIGTITYGTDKDEPVLLNADDFNTAFLTKTGFSLNYVTFTLPASTVGTLYLGYNSPTSYSSLVSASSRYYRTIAPLLSNVSFVPKTGYTGTVTIQYKGYSSSGAAFLGKININVGTAVPYTDLTSYAWANDAISYLYRNGVIADSGAGKFYPGENMTRGDFVEMIVNAFNIGGAGAGSFSDVPPGSYYYDAVSAAKALNIITGYADGKFHPGTGLTRQDAMVIIVRALGAVGIPLSTGSASDLAIFSDADQVNKDYALVPVASLVRTGFVKGSGGKLFPKDNISRAETSVMLYRILTM